MSNIYRASIHKLIPVQPDHNKPSTSQFMAYSMMSKKLTCNALADAHHWPLCSPSGWPGLPTHSWLCRIRYCPWSLSAWLCLQSSRPPLGRHRHRQCERSDMKMKMDIFTVGVTMNNKKYLAELLHEQLSWSPISSWLTLTNWPLWPLLLKKITYNPSMDE